MHSPKILLLTRSWRENRFLNLVEVLVLDPAEGQLLSPFEELLHRLAGGWAEVLAERLPYAAKDSDSFLVPVLQPLPGRAALSKIRARWQRPLGVVMIKVLPLR
jgi:hypothetical protein